MLHQLKTVMNKVHKKKQGPSTARTSEQLDPSMRCLNLGLILILTKPFVDDGKKRIGRCADLQILQQGQSYG